MTFYKFPSMFYIMKVHGICLILFCFSIIATGNSIQGKPLFQNKLNALNNKYYPVKRIAPNPTQLSGSVSSNDFEDTLLETANNVPLQQSIGNARSLRSFDMKQSPIEHTLNLKTETIKKRNLFSERKDEPYGVVFSHGKAIGVLKPLSHSYELSSFEDEPASMEQANAAINDNAKMAVKREVNQEENAERANDDNSYYANGRYPVVLANFKIGNRLQMSRANSDHKRENPVLRKSIPPLKMDPEHKFNKRGLPDATVDVKNVAGQENLASENIDQIEDNIRGIINDLGLAEQEENKEKRSANVDAEDENLENGANKLSLRKDTHEKLSRQKKEEKIEEGVTSEGVSTEKSNLEKRESEAESSKPSESEAKSDESRKKREGADIVKGLEMSGELTVSGNKSPLASSSNEHEVEVRSTQQVESAASLKKKRDNQQKEFEKEIEENLQQKINAIKEQVKREYKNLKYAGVDDPRNKREAPAVRQNTLVDEESKSLNPEVSNDQPLVPHIRAKRDNPTMNDNVKVVVENAKDINKNIKKEVKNHIMKREIKPSSGDNENCPKNLGAQNRPGTAKAAPEHKQDRNILDEINAQADQAIQNSNIILERVKDEIAIANGAKENNEYGKTEECPGKTKLNEEAHGTIDRGAKNCPRVKKNTDLESKVDHKDVIKKGSANIVTADLEKKDDKLQGDLSDAKDFEGVKRRRRSNYGEKYFLRKNMKGYENIPYLRRKRSNSIGPDGNPIYSQFRSEDDEVDEEGDELDDDGFDDRTASLVRNRREDYFNPGLEKNEEYDSLSDNDYEGSDNLVNEYYPKGLKMKRNLQSRNYVDNLNSDSDASNYDNYAKNLYFAESPYQRRKRSYEDGYYQMEAENGPQFSSRSRYPSRRNFRRKRLGSEMANTRKYEGELTDADIFGALPQSYEGELSRFKRVKRSNTNPKTTS